MPVEITAEPISGETIVASPVGSTAGQLDFSETAEAGLIIMVF